MIKIKSIFFLILLCFMPAMLRADVQINAEISLRTEISGYDADFLKNVIRQLDRYARSAKLRNSRQQLNIICGTSDSFRIAGKYLYIPGDAGLWQENFALRRKIYGVLAAHRFNFRYPAGSAGVAPWIANALDSELLAAETSGQYFVSNRSFPLLTGFAANCGRLPNFEAMAKLQYPCRDKVLQDIAGEQGRILLHILADAGKTGELFSRSCAGGDPAEFITYFSSPQQAEEILNQAAGRFLWNRMHPMPARAALKQLPQLEKIMVPLVDENMTATGEFKEYSWQDFAILMENQPDRQDRNQLTGRFAKNFSLLSRSLTVEESRICSILTGDAASFGSDPASKEKFAKNLEELKKTLAVREKKEQFLLDTLLFNTPLPDTLSRLFQAAMPDNLSESKAHNDFLLRVMNEYLE